MKQEHRLCTFLVVFGLTAASAHAAAPPRLRVSDNHRSLVTEHGRPFFWLGDTAWEFFHRFNRKDAVTSLDECAHKGFAVIQAVLLAEVDSLNTHPPPPPPAAPRRSGVVPGRTGWGARLHRGRLYRAWRLPASLDLGVPNYFSKLRFGEAVATSASRR